MIRLNNRLIKTSLFSLLISLVSFPAFALEETSQRPEFEVATVLGSLLLVLVCIFVFAFLMKKSNLVRFNGQNTPIRVIATQALTSKSRVQIIEVHGKQYLLGVSEQSVNLLDQLEVPVETDDISPAMPKTMTFKSALASVLNKAGNKNNE